LPTRREIIVKNLTTLVATTTLAACSVCTFALADTSLEPRSVTVHYEDLNTNNSYGAATLYKRIHAAAVTVCSDIGPSRTLTLLGSYASCVHGAISVAIARVNRPAVTEYAASRGIVPAVMPIKDKFARNN
jgi:UrcA family protein